jgi:hypothetical protein
MEIPALTITLQELRDELERPHWESLELDGVIALGQFLVLNEDAHCHQVVQPVAPIRIRT